MTPPFCNIHQMDARDCHWCCKKAAKQARSEGVEEGVDKGLEDAAKVADKVHGYDPYGAKERIAKEIRALKGKG